MLKSCFLRNSLLYLCKLYLIMGKYRLTLNREQLVLISQALEFYMRIGIGQFDEIIKHPTFEKTLEGVVTFQGEVDYELKREIENKVGNLLAEARNKLCDLTVGRHGGYGINNNQVDEDCRVAYDIHQVIRHQFWNERKDKSFMTVDSSISYTSSGFESIKIEKLKLLKK